MNKVYVINKSVHDFSDALRFGELIYLSEGMIDRYATTRIFREFYARLKDSGPEDHILITGLNTMNIIACCIFALKHKKLNLLIHKTASNTYVERILDLTQIEE